MSITLDELKHIAHLARIDLKPEELTRFRSDLNAILGYIEVLKIVDTTDVEPLAQVTGLENVFREDVAEKSPLADEILKNAPEKQGRLIKVKKVF